MKFLKKLKEKWNNLHLQSKITLCILTASLIPAIIIASTMSGKFLDMVKADAISSAQESSRELKPLVEDQIEEIEHCMRLVTGEGYYSMLFNNLASHDPEYYAKTPAAASFAKSVKEIVSSSIVNAVKIYVSYDDAKLFNPEGADIFENDKNIRGTYWHGIFSGKPYGELFCPTFYLGNANEKKLGDQAYIRRTTMNLNNNVYSAFVVVYYDTDVYSELMKKSLVFDEAVTYIINDRDAVVATTDENKSGLYRMSYDDVRNSLMSSNSFEEKRVADTDIYAAFNRIDRTDWFMVTIIPQAPVRAESNTMAIRFFSIIALSMAAALALAILLARNITSRILVVEDRMRMARQAAPVALPEPKIKDEVGELISSYNFMTDQITKLLAEEEKNAEDLRAAEFNSLQAQINPHFLYNTMDMINWMAVQGKNKEVSETVQDLAKFYKLTLSRSKSYSIIQDEIEHAKVYIQLQNRRFEDKINFLCDVPEELTIYRIPKLTFQPILENAILHGIMEKEEKEGTIVLTAWEEDNCIHIEISDDGAGMDEDSLKNILSEKTEDSRKGSNIAIYNIHRRLKLLYGDRYGLSYESRLGEGCTVSILIPKHTGDEPYKRDE